MDKKQSSNWYIAVAHFLTTGLVALGINVVFWVIFNATVSSMSALPYTALNLGVPVIAVVLGALYSARYVAKTYLLPSPESVVKISSFIFILIPAVVVGAVMLMAESVGTGAIAVWGQIVVSAVLFYVLSKKYIVGALVV